MVPREKSDTKWIKEEETYERIENGIAKEVK